MNFRGNSGGEFFDEGWGGVLGCYEGECLGEGYLIGGVGRGMEFVVLRLHGG